MRTQPSAWRSEEGRAALLPTPPLVDGALASLLSLAAHQDCPGLWLPEASKTQEHFAQKIQYSLKFEISVSNQENIQFSYSHKQTAGALCGRYGSSSEKSAVTPDVL